MKNWKALTSICIGLGFLGFRVSASVIPYPVPPTVTDTNRMIFPSLEYDVTIIQDGRSYPIFTYCMPAMARTNNCKTTAWSPFSFSGTVEVRVKKRNGSITFSQVLPREPHIPVQQTDSQTISFTLHKPGQYSVEFEKGIDIKHPLLLFADALEDNPPSAQDPDVIYFGPGEHRIGSSYSVAAGKTVYIAPGALVRGQFLLENGANTTISGRGILSGEDFPARSGEDMIRGREVENVQIKDITIVHAPAFNITMSGSNHIIQNVKMMGWWFSTDGVSTGENARIEDCFFKVNDDAIKLYNNNTLVRRCVIWQMENGMPFQMGWNLSRDVAGFYVSDCDIIRVEHRWDNPNEAVIGAVHGSKGIMQQYVFERIRIDNSHWRIFHITTQPNRWGSWNTERGKIARMLFRDITFYGNMKIPNLIKGFDTAHPIEDIVFENIRINNELITSLDKRYFIVDDKTCRNVRVVTETNTGQ